MAGMAPCAKVPRSMVRRTASAMAALIAATAIGAWSSQFGSLPSDQRFSKDQASLFDAKSLNRVEVRPPSAMDIALRVAKGLLAQKLRDRVSSSSEHDELPSRIPAAPPLPKPRPAASKLGAPERDVAQSGDRTLVQKLSDLMQPRTTLASLTPGDGVFRETPDIAGMGYDNLTAVYGISERVVYLPNGGRLEAHSGFGSMRDDPRHVSEQNVGATPPAIYELRRRERPFHGVQALRMIPVEGSTTLGRSGLLAHGYMLGPDGDSNGCVSIKDYEGFFVAFQSGKIKRLVVVPSLADLTRQPLKS